MSEGCKFAICQSTCIFFFMHLNLEASDARTQFKVRKKDGSANSMLMEKDANEPEPLMNKLHACAHV